MGNGHSIQGNVIYIKVTIKVQGATLKQDFLPLSLDGYDVILGMH